MPAGIVGLAATALTFVPAFTADVTVRDLTLRLHHADRAHPLQLNGLDLRELDLSGLDFKGARLANSNMFGADLSRADLSKADLHGARLDRVVIIGARFDGADLSGTSFLRPRVSRHSLHRRPRRRALPALTYPAQ
jgi:uncharacterized protein YjbI with pentapeptide repeats